MDPLIAKLIDQLNSSVFVLLGILALSFWAIYRLGLLVAKFTAQDNTICKLEGLAEKVIVLTTKVDLIYQNTNPHRTVASASPMGLTKLGDKISVDIDAPKILAKYLKQLIAEVDNGSPKNAYDIQQASMNVARGRLVTFLDETELGIVKQEAYSCGILVEDVLAVVGILLRNHITEDNRAIQALCELCGGSFLPAGSAIKCDCSGASINALKEFSDMMQETAKALKDGKVRAAEADRVRGEAVQAQRAIADLLLCLDARAAEGS